MSRLKSHSSSVSGLPDDSPQSLNLDAYAGYTYRTLRILDQAGVIAQIDSGAHLSTSNTVVTFSFLDLDHLKVFVARPTYLLAMKCAAMRLGEEFHDLDDVRYLLRYLNITHIDEATEIVTRYFDEATLPPKTWLALEELLPA